VIFDVDGVLADASKRQWMIEWPNRHWDGFFQACGDDDLIEDVAATFGVLRPDLQIVLLTARPIWVQRQTLEWLDRVDIPWDVLIMRDYGDYDASRNFKRRTLADLRAWGFDPELSYEDDPRNVMMFRAEGVPCVYIHSGYYD